MTSASDTDKTRANFAQRLRQELQLNLNQWSRIKLLHRNGGKAAQPLLEQLRQLGQEMCALSENSRFGDNAMYDLAARRARLEVELTHLVAHTHTAIYQVFTPAQQQRLAVLQQQGAGTLQMSLA